MCYEKLPDDYPILHDTFIQNAMDKLEDGFKALGTELDYPHKSLLLDWIILSIARGEANPLRYKWRRKFSMMGKIYDRKRFDEPFYERINTTTRKGEKGRSIDTKNIEGKVADLIKKNEAEIEYIMENAADFARVVHLKELFRKYAGELKKIYDL
jgi:hypothetical protein